MGIRFLQGQVVQPQAAPAPQSPPLTPRRRTTSSAAARCTCATRPASCSTPARSSTTWRASTAGWPRTRPRSSRCSSRTPTARPPPRSGRPWSRAASLRWRTRRRGPWRSPTGRRCSSSSTRRQGLSCSSVRISPSPPAPARTRTAFSRAPDYGADVSAVPYVLDEFAYCFETPFSTTDPDFPQYAPAPPLLLRLPLRTVRTDSSRCAVDRPPGASADGRFTIVNHVLDVDILPGNDAVLVPFRAMANRTNSVESIMNQTALCEAAHGRTPNFVLVDFVERGTWLLLLLLVLVPLGRCADGPRRGDEGAEYHESLVGLALEEEVVANGAMAASWVFIIIQCRRTVALGIGKSQIRVGGE